VDEEAGGRPGIRGGRKWTVWTQICGRGVSEGLDLGAMFSPDVVAALQGLVDRRVAAAMAAVQAESGSGAAPWLTLDQAAERLGCSPDAVRMRVKRGRLESRREGRRVYVSRESVDGLP